jgi:PqqD family protein of HPr-rel-A system
MNRLARLAINDEGFVFDPANGDSFQVSLTGLHILNGIRAGHADEEIAQTLAEKYDVSLEEAQRDLADFQANLKNLGLA